MLRDSPPAGKDDYISLTESNTFPLFFAQPDGSKIEKLLIVWSACGKMWQRLQGFRRRYLKASNLHAKASFMFIVANFLFFSFVTSFFGPFLTVYQTDWPVLPFIYQDLTDLVTKLPQVFIKPDALTKCTSGTALKSLDLTKRRTFWVEASWILGLQLNLLYLRL